MANVIKKATNKFTKGLVMDFSPENTKNEVLTHALNATLLTFNGNELSLQNDMGNARVETAYLPDGYIPVGTCEYGGIIYIVSYNPLEDKSQIGCFPSPERNISSDELGEKTDSITQEDFIAENGDIKNISKQVILRNDPLNPGDKFIVTANSAIYGEKLHDLYTNSSDGFKIMSNPFIALNIVSIEDNGKITYLNSNVIKYEQGNYKYHILGSKTAESSVTKEDIDAYRTVTSSGYNVFKSKISGKLAILAELITVDSYSVTHKIKPQIDSDGNVKPNWYDVILSIEASSQDAYNKYSVIPDLSYYYLKKSSGYIPVLNNANQQVKKLMSDSDFLDTPLTSIYDLSQYESLQGKKLSDISEYNFPNENTYHKAEVSDQTSKTDPVRIYDELYLASIKINPPVNTIPLFFTYEYTLVPCMEYGKLNHLEVSNIINFANINDFNKSNFNTWKYRVDGNQLRLTVGTEVYDTFAEHGDVIGIVLEFYDYRGFAGSLIIQNRQSYSGEFTKLINLNSLGALSNKKLQKSNDEWVFMDQYQRSISIEKLKDNSYSLNEFSVTYDESIGWRCSGENPDLPINDCGTLYSNIVYGVKPYFLQKGSDENKYIVSERKQLFLFTSTLLNAHYYEVRNFNILQPKLDLVLTYKLNDKSVVSNYPYGDQTEFNSYKNGTYKNSELIGTQYLQYKGTSSLQLEVGLKQDYKDLGIYNIPDINDKFQCTLFLKNDSGEALYDIKSDNSELISSKDIIGYDPSTQTDIKNNISFESGESELLIKGITKYTFLSNPDNKNNIPINYNFIVGHEVNITNIKDSKVPSTTVCALCHKREDGTYNYEDFGIYEVSIGSEQYYFSNTIIYNAGDSTKETLGLYKQQGMEGNLGDQCYSVQESSQDAVTRTRAGALGSGKNLKSLVNSIGNLTFCLPHAHGALKSEYGWPNIYDTVHVVNADQENPKGVLNLGRPIDPEFTFKHKDIMKGIRPAFYYYKIPRYNSCLLTQTCIDQCNELISTMEINILEEGRTANDQGSGDKMDRYDSNDFETIVSSEFIGFTGNQLQEYNKKLIQTMKSVYAYNPDYDYITISQGDITIKDTKCKFTSNLFSKDANLFIKGTNDPITSLNDYICFGQVPISYYLTEMDKFSDIVVKENDQWVKQIDFIPDLTYCGGNGYTAMLTTLTYNIPKPTQLYRELTYDNSNQIMIKKEDGTTKMLDGIPNKYALYGYIEDKNSLVQLDVSNYNIDNDGFLSFTNKRTLTQTWDLSKVINIDDGLLLDQNFSDSYKWEVSCKPINKVNDLTMKEGKGGVILWCESSEYMPAQAGLQVNKINPDFRKNAKCNWKLKIHAMGINTEYMSKEKSEGILFNFAEQSYDDLYNFVTGSDNTVLIDTDGNAINVPKGVIYYQTNKEKVVGFGVKIGINSNELTIGALDCILQHPETDPFTSTPQKHSIYSDATSNPVIFLIEYVSIEVQYTNNVNYNPNTLVSNYPVVDYGYYDKNNIEDTNIEYEKYQIKACYKNTLIAQTSITLNDLQYIPNPTGHRLYIKPNLVRYDTSLNNKVYYRYLDMSTVDGNYIFGTEKDGDCVYETTKDKNCLCLFTGPCFTPNTLTS